MRIPAVAAIVFFCLLSIPSCGAKSGLTIPGQDSILNGLKESHPRLILTEERISEIRDQTASDPAAAEFLKQLIEKGESILGQEPVVRSVKGPRKSGLSACRTALDRITTLALLYRLDGDPKWLNRAVEEMRAGTDFVDWNPEHYLDVAEMCTAISLGYDWLYEYLSPEDRLLFETNIKEKALLVSLSHYDAPSKWTQRTDSNWNNVCNCGMIIGALAVADKEPELSADVIGRALKSLQLVLPNYAPDGGWPEGQSYWNYATRYTLKGAFSLKTALGTDFGIMDSPGIRETGYFPLSLIGPTGKAFDFADSSAVPLNGPWLYSLASWYNDPAYAYFAENSERTNGITAFDLLFFYPAGDAASIPLDKYYTRVELATMRSSWTDPDALYIGFKAGDNGVSHSHLDLGSFVMESGGVRWAIDLGRGGYDLPDYFDAKGGKRWNYYRLNTMGHNTLLIDGLNQDPKAQTIITTFITGKDRTFAVADLTNAYAPTGISKVQRSVELGGNRSSILIQDEINSDKPADILWAMHTRATIEIDRTGKTAVLSSDGRTLRARILSPYLARFEWEEPKLDPPQPPLDGVRKLFISLPRCIGKTRITVIFTPGGNDRPAPEATPLDEWK